MASFDRGLLLHVGLPKTGSTTLQRTLFAKHSQLLYLGKYVKTNNVEKGCLSEEVYKILRSVLWNDRGPFDSDKIEKAYRAEILPKISEDTCLIGSWEALGNRSPENYLMMVDRVQKIFGSCRIIYVLRNPLTQAPSQYLQHIEGGFVRQGRRWMGVASYLDMEAWFEKKCDEKSVSHSPPNYFQNLQASVELLGKENVGVFLFENLVRDPEAYYRSISRFIGIDADEAYALSQQKRFNERTTQGQLNLIRRLYSSCWSRALLPLLSSKQRRKLLTRFAEDTGPAKIDLTPELHEKISIATRDGHRWLVEKLDLPLEQYDYPL